MATEKSIQDEGWSGVKHLFHSLNFLDWLVVAGFILSIGVMALTVYFMQRPDIIVRETNPLLNYIFTNVNDYYLVLFFGLLWGVALTIYWKMRESLAGVYCSFYIFSLFLFNFVHDITVVVLK